MKIETGRVSGATIPCDGLTDRSGVTSCRLNGMRDARLNGMWVEMWDWMRDELWDEMRG